MEGIVDTVGVMRLPALRSAGVPIELGTDGPVSNDRLDLLDEARTAAWSPG